ncbi:MAG: M56 family metallopeptidase [Acidobacteriota bacterium]
MTWAAVLVDWIVTNAAAASALAVLGVIAEPWLRRRPGLVHALWVLVLARLLVPPVWTPEMTVDQTSNDLVAGGLSVVAASVLPTSSRLARESAPTLAAEILVLAVVLSISAVLLIVAGLGVRRLRLRVADSRPADPDLVEHWRALADRLGVTTPPPLVFADGRFSPMLVSVAGWSRVVLPNALWDRLSAAERDALLLHELAHFKRRDHWVRHLETLAVALYWWHPAAWWASRRLRRHEELACDRRVTAAAPEHRRAYADALLQTVNFLGRHRPAANAFACGLRTVDDLKGRLDMIFRSDRPKRVPALVRLTMMLFAAVALAASPSLVASPDVPHPDAMDPTAPGFRGQPLDLHLDDVPWIQPVSRIAEVSGLNVVVEPGIAVHRPVTLHLDDIPWDQALEQLLTLYDLESTFENGVLWIHHPGRFCGSDATFEGQPIDIRVRDANLGDVLRTFKDYAGIDVALADGIEGTVELTLLGIPWDQALDTILRLNRLSARIEGGALMIHRPTTPADDC